MGLGEPDRRDASLCGERKFQVPQPPSIEDFSIVKPISRGAFGKVYLARRKNNSRLFAVKVVKKADMINKNMVHQVQAERDALALSKSPFIVHLYYSLQSANNIYLVMEYLIGGDVKSLLHIYGYFDEDMAVKYISEVALALDYLHRHSIIHRDLKPDNMLISNEGHIKLTDFGLSKVTLKRELNMIDILTTPSMAKPKQDYFRTPGQVLSLISSLGFNSPVRGKMQPCASTVTPAHNKTTEENLTPPILMKNKENSMKVNKLLISCPEVNTSNLSMPVKCLTPNLLKFRARLGTSTASSHSHLCLSSMESDYCSSPKWENDNQDPEGPPYLSSSRLQNNLSDKSLAKVQLGKVAKYMKDLESNFSPIVHRENGKKSDAQNRANELKDTPIGSVNAKGLIRKCLYDPSMHEEKENLDAGEFKSFPRSPVSPPWLPSSSMDPINYSEDEVAERTGLKRGFSLVETSPGQDLMEKKSSSQYKRAYQIADVPVKSSTGLTVEIESLFLADLQQGAVHDDKQVETFVPAPITPEKLCSENPVAKNLLCELDMNSSNSGSDNAGSWKQSPEGNPNSSNASVTAPSLEEEISDVDRSMKELSFESQNEANGGSTLEDTGVAAICEDKEQGESKSMGRVLTELDSNAWASPATTRQLPSTAKKAVVGFRSYNSTINGSNLSEPSRISIGSVDKIPFSLGCTGSYPMTVTPAQRDRTYKNFQGQAETPYRTPKSVRRGAAQIEKEKILGTPDYLAPELLLGKSHGFAVDWWALGVCLFEFLTGIPPFNDETPAQVFQNILKRDIPWPEDDETLSVNAHSAIDILLTLDHTKRAGLKDLKANPLFLGIEWDNLHIQPMPFIPQPEDETDTTYFEARNNAQDLKVSGFSL